MTSRLEHLAWCKARALELVDDDPPAAVASMLSDLRKWEGGAMYDPLALQLMAAEGMLYRRTPAEVRDWVEGWS